MEADFIVLSPHSKGLTKHNVMVEFSPEKYNRQKDNDTELLIESTWQKRRLENPRIFNGTKFRLHQINWTTDKCPVLCLGLTYYKDYLGTNCSDQVEDLYKKGLNKYNNAQAYMSDALGVGTFLITSDDKFVFLRRSQYCSEAQGLLDGPGGHAEPDMIEGIFTMDSDKISTQALIDELFDSIVREIIDEANIPRGYLLEPTLLGITKNFTTGGRMSAEFLVRCGLSSTEVADLFNEGTQPEAEESTDILFRSTSEVMDLDETKEPKTWLEYAPATRARIIMYKHLQQNENKQKELNEISLHH